MAVVRYLESMGFGEQGQFGVAGVSDDLFIFLIPDITDALEEQQREDVGLEVGGIYRAAQDVGGRPQVGFELGKGNCLILHE